MIYYKDLADLQIYAYDETDDTQEPYIQKAIDNGWESITDEEAEVIRLAKMPAPVELTPQEKLANAGLSVDELKVLLGIA